MGFNATFNNISVISLRSVLLVEDTEVPERTTDMSYVTDKHNYYVFVILYPKYGRIPSKWEKNPSPSHILNTMTKTTY